MNSVLDRVLNSRVTVLLFFIGVAILYSSFLVRVPIHLNQDELGFSLNAYSITTTGLDENGRFLPLYFWHLNVMWATPVIVYLTALFLTVLPLSEITIRLPSVLVGLVNLALVYFLAKKLFGGRNWGLLAAGFLALTPVHFIHSRILLDNLFIVPFVLGWLLLLFLYLTKKKPWLLFLAVFTLGIGVHSYHAAKIMMPFYFIATLLVMLPEIRKRISLFFVSLIAFILPLLPLVPWLSQYPETLVDQVRYTRLYDTQVGVLSGVATLFTPESISHRAEVFFSYFDPSFLFFRGDASLIHSTQKAGVFLLSFIVLLLLGIKQALGRKRARFTILLVIGFITAPIAAALVGDYGRISRALVILPFATLLAVYGVNFLLLHKNNALRAACYVLLLLIPFQFIYFLNDYFIDYRTRSYAWFNYNIPGALETVIANDKKIPADYIFLDGKVNFLDRYWRFFAIKHNSQELLTKTRYINPPEIDLFDLPTNSLLLLNSDHVDGLATEAGPFKKIQNVIEPDGTSRFYIYRN